MLEMGDEHGGGLGFWAPATVDAFDNIDGLVLSKEVLSFGTFGVG